MSCIVHQKVGTHTYLYESVSYRDERGKPQARRVSIGKIDPDTGREIYKHEYLERMAAAGTPVTVYTSPPTFTEGDVQTSSILHTGMALLLKHCAHETGLSAVLRDTFPQTHELLFALACHIVCRGEPSAYCEQWLEETDLAVPSRLSSQRISDLVSSLPESQVLRFYQAWVATRSEQEYLALDITSVSSYSQLIDDVDWGYNRDQEKLPQVNICLLTGEESHLPVRMVVYDGSIKDVSTLTTTMAGLTDGIGSKVRIVTDKGFTSKRNIDAMLALGNVEFIMALPFTLAFADTQVRSEKKDIADIRNAMTIGSDVFYGVTKRRTWGTTELFTHICYNEVKATCERNHLYGYVANLRSQAVNDPWNGKLKAEFAKYLIIRRSEKREDGVTVTIRQDVVDDHLAHAGWMVCVSNSVDTVQVAIRIYRAKDVVEKSFLRTKNSLGINRLRVHSQEAMNGKMLVAFIALILNSHIHKVMQEKNLYRSMSMTDLVKTMEKLKVMIIGTRRIEFPATKKQKEIAEAFGLKSLSVG
jgi:transposase